jgi:hypothetical protein
MTRNVPALAYIRQAWHLGEAMRCHPYDDGNGRLAGLVLLFALLRDDVELDEVAPILTAVCRADDPDGAAGLWPPAAARSLDTLVRRRPGAGRVDRGTAEVTNTHVKIAR